MSLVSLISDTRRQENYLARPNVCNLISFAPVGGGNGFFSVTRESVADNDLKLGTVVVLAQIAEHDHYFGPQGNWFLDAKYPVHIENASHKFLLEPVANDMRFEDVKKLDHPLFLRNVRQIHYSAIPDNQRNLKQRDPINGEFNAISITHRIIVVNKLSLPLYVYNFH